MRDAPFLTPAPVSTADLTAAEHDRRVAELLAANNAELEHRRRAVHEARAWRAAADASAMALAAAQDEITALRTNLEAVIADRDLLLRQIRSAVVVG